MKTFSKASQMFSADFLGDLGGQTLTQTQGKSLGA
jgi:hypothetical protein